MIGELKGKIGGSRPHGRMLTKVRYVQHLWCLQKFCKNRIAPISIVPKKRRVDLVEGLELVQDPAQSAV